jgi:transposase
MKGTRDLKQMEVRRKRGVELYKQGWNQYEIAETLGVTQPSVSKWIRAEANGGEKALDSHPPPGREKKITAEEFEELAMLLMTSPSSYGFEGELWTSPMVTELIRLRFRVKYHPGNVRKILRQMGFSPQKPVKRAVQRDEEAIGKWCREEWPRIKKTPKGGVRQ